MGSRGGVEGLCWEHGRGQRSPTPDLVTCLLGPQLGFFLLPQCPLEAASLLTSVPALHLLLAFCL